MSKLRRLGLLSYCTELQEQDYGLCFGEQAQRVVIFSLLSRSSPRSFG